MGDEQDGQSELVPQFLHELQHLGLNRDVQGAGGLVQNQKAWAGSERFCQRNALPLTTREGAGQGIETFRPDSHPAQQVAGTVLGFLAPLFLMQAEDIGHGVAYRDARVQRQVGILEHYLDVLGQGFPFRGFQGAARTGDVPQSEFTCRGGFQSHHQPGKGGLSGT